MSKNATDSVLNSARPRVLKAKSNLDIARAIWTDASYEYQHRIPEPTQGNIVETFDKLMSNDYTPQRNEFVDALVNRIGDVVFRSKVWTNPLAVFKRGMMRYGDTVEEIAGGILKAKRYDPNDCYTDVFACNPPEIWANYHTINRQDRYDLTVKEPLLRRAFVDDYGISRTLDIIMQMPYNSDEYDEFLIMKRLFAEYARVNGFYRITVPEITDAMTQSERRDAAYTITEKIRAAAGRLRFMSGAYNPQGVPTFTNPNELVLIATPDFVATMDVNVIAAAFNVSAADLNFRTVLVDDLGIDGAQAILCDQDFFVCMDTLLEFRSIENPKALSWNYFLHHWGIYSLSTFVNAVLFTTEAGTTSTVPAIDVETVTVAYAPAEDGTVPTFVEPGTTQRFVSTTTGTVMPETPGYEVPNAVVWTISATGGVPLKQLTYIDPEGVLHVAEDESNEQVTVKAVNTYIDPTKPISEQVAKSGELVVGIGKAVEAAASESNEAK